MKSTLDLLKNKAYGAIFWRTAIGEMLTALHSILLHFRFSFSDRNPGTDKQRLEYYLLKHCHIVEKGLALPAPRKGFGQPKIANLISKTRMYEKNHSITQVGMMVRDTLREYIDFHAHDLQILPNDFLQNVNKFLEEIPEQSKGGLKRIKKSEMKTCDAKSFENFLKCRHSVRNFSTTPVDNEVIFRVLNISQNTPSVCNRQGWIIHYFNNKEKIQELLSFQNGNAGFTDTIDKLLIVTASTKAFTRYEHNQLFIDGGLYSMNLMLALHAAGLGSCPLNTCMPWLEELRLKQTADIPKHERLVMMIAVGNLLDEFSVAQSEKYPVEKVLRQH